jgi:hypothetical protein
MLIPNPDTLPIAVRVYPAPANAKTHNNRPPKRWRRPGAMFVFDTETRTDATQRLTFGSYRFVVNGECLEESIFHADDLPERDRNILRQYVSTHRAETARGNRELKLLTRSEFLGRLFKAVYKGRCLLVGFNLPFDLSRIAFDVATARGRYAGGFSLGLWSYMKDAVERHDNYRPRIFIKHIDSKRALKGFTARNNPDKNDLIPDDDSEPCVGQQGQTFRGNFLDLRTLAFALTDRGYSLETACEAFGVEHGKQRVALHGEITEEYIDYNRRDVLASCELAIKLLEEYDRHPLALQVTKAYSPASIGKGYLRSMGIKPILQRQPEFSKEILGHAQSTFFGGRTSAHIRKVSVPVVFTDFLSMYPTVNCHMGLWKFVWAREIRVDRNCVEEIRQFLSVTPADLFDPAAWKKLATFVRIAPDGDILPVRGRFSESNDWQIALNYLHGDRDDPERTELWFSLPDVIASVILTGRVPKIIDAFRLKAVGVQPGLKPVKLRNAIEVDPRSEDFFKVVIEERKRLKSRADFSKDERDQLDKALKVLANSTSYGIYAEMNRQESDESVSTVCHGIDPQPFRCMVSHPDNPGEYCFPPLASLITGTARLMLALLEHCVTELGGTYAMEDTDSMAIVATEHGGPVSCPGGLERIGRKPAVWALSWKQVDSISKRFECLNPYDRSAVPGSVLKIEEYNFDPKTGKQRHIFCHAISAKRYVLFVRDDKTGAPNLLEKAVNSTEDKWSEHGLGHLLNPTDPNSNDRKWIKQAWLNIIRKADGLEIIPVPFAKTPAVGRVTISSPAVMRAFREMNEGKRYCDQIKPFNFVLTCHVNRFGHPTFADPAHFHLIAPYETDPGKWSRNEWIDRYSGSGYRITT